MNVTWYFDVISPFAHLALPRVLALGKPMALRPVLFAGLLSHWGQLGPAEIVPKRLHTYRLVQFQSEQAGRPMRFPPAHPFRSLEAMRLLAALDGAPEAVRAAFDFIWSEGRDPSAEFAALRERLPAVSESALATAKETLRAATTAAAEAGVFGVPTLAIDGELFWGVDAMPMAEAFLADPDLLMRGEMARIVTLPIGAARRTG